MLYHSIYHVLNAQYISIFFYFEYLTTVLLMKKIPVYLFLKCIYLFFQVFCISYLKIKVEIKEYTRFMMFHK